MSFVFFGFCWSDVAARPWLEAGHQVVIADIKHQAGLTCDGLLCKIGCDLSTPDYVKSVLQDRGKCIFAGFFPPCTDVAVSGSRWFAEKGLRALQQSVSFFATAQELAAWLGAPYFIENPISVMSSHWRKPDYIFDPCDFTALSGHDNYTKKTCLWTGNGFKMPAPARQPGLPPPDERIWRMSNTKDRATKRSMTPEGFSRAVYLAHTGQQPRQIVRCKYCQDAPGQRCLFCA